MINMSAEDLQKFLSIKQRLREIPYTPLNKEPEIIDIDDDWELVHSGKHDDVGNPIYHLRSKHIVERYVVEINVEEN